MLASPHCRLVAPVGSTEAPSINSLPVDQPSADQAQRTARLVKTVAEHRCSPCLVAAGRLSQDRRVALNELAGEFVLAPIGPVR
jgi:hypothetical protein